MKVDETRGKLVIIGGGEDKEGDCEILKEFVRLAGGAKAHVVVMTSRGRMMMRGGQLNLTEKFLDEGNRSFKLSGRKFKLLR